MPYSDNLKVAWFLPMRTASRSCRVICEYFKFIDSNLHRPPSVKDGYYYICNVRNPYPRLLSLYELFCLNFNLEPINFKTWVIHKLKEEIDSPEFTLDYQTNLSGVFQRYKKYPTQFIRSEFLNEDLLTLDFIKNETSEEFKKIYSENILVNNYKTEKFPKFFGEYYDEELAEYVYSFLKEDFLLFGYDKNSWKNGTP